MCGRFTLVTDKDVLKKRFNIVNMDELKLDKKYNIAPTQDVLAIINDGKYNRGGLLRWGLIPSWAKEMTIGNRMINAREETLEEKVSFKKLLLRRRCLIIADSFYEWEMRKGKKQPLRFMLKENQPFAFAGLWDRWVKDGKEVVSCTIITTKANNTLEGIHDRMPVILKEDREKIWLDRAIEDINFLKEILTPYPDDLMESYKVSTIVNSPKADTEDCIKPLFE